MNWLWNFFIVTAKKFMFYSLVGLDRNYTTGYYDIVWRGGASSMDLCADPGIFVPTFFNIVR